MLADCWMSQYGSVGLLATFDEPLSVRYVHELSEIRPNYQHCPDNRFGLASKAIVKWGGAGWGDLHMSSCNGMKGAGSML